MPQFHIKCEKEDISSYVILVGNPQRAERIAKEYLTEARLVNTYRLLYIYTGFYKDTRLTVATTGMGAPSCAIVMEELINLGGKVLIRTGSAGGIDLKLNVGDVVIATASVRDDGTTPSYLRETFPAVADFDVLAQMIQTGRQIKSDIQYGVVISQDSFYRPYSDSEMNDFVNSGVKAIEMESGCVFIVAHYRGVKAGAIFALDGNVTLKAMKPEGHEQKFIEGENKAIEISLESMHELAKRGFE